jgi:hypothetical protein
MNAWEQTGRYPLPHYRNVAEFPDEPDMWEHLWTAQDYTLSVALDVDDNYVAQHLVVDRLAQRHPGVAERVAFDSEFGCFFAHADSDADMAVLYQVIGDLVAERNPDAVPGDMWSSPGALRRWNDLLDR